MFKIKFNMLLFFLVGLLFNFQYTQGDDDEKNYNQHDFSSEHNKESPKCRIHSPSSNLHLNETWLFTPGRMYFPLVSKLNAYQQVEVLLGRSAKNSDEVSKLCRTCEFGANGIALERGFDNTVVQTCVPYLEKYQYSCTAGFASVGTNTAPYSKYILNGLATDNKTYMLFARCTNDVFESWQLLTTSPNLEETNTSIEKIRAIIAKFGFNPSNLLAPGCTKCGRTNPNQPYRSLSN